MAAATNGASGASAAKAARTKAGEKRRMDVGRVLFGTGGTYRVVVDECQRQRVALMEETMPPLVARPRAFGDALLVCLE